MHGWRIRKRVLWWIDLISGVLLALSSPNLTLNPQPLPLKIYFKKAQRLHVCSSPFPSHLTSFCVTVFWLSFFWPSQKPNTILNSCILQTQRVLIPCSEVGNCNYQWFHIQYCIFYLSPYFKQLQHGREQLRHCWDSHLQSADNRPNTFLLCHSGAHCQDTFTGEEGFEPGWNELILFSNSALKQHSINVKYLK